MADQYRLTVNGGHIVEHGPLTKCMIAAVAEIAAFHTVYLRQLPMTRGVLTITPKRDGPHTLVQYTEDGQPAVAPHWVTTATTLLTINQPPKETT